MLLCSFGPHECAKLTKNTSIDMNTVIMVETSTFLLICLSLVSLSICKKCPPGRFGPRCSDKCQSKCRTCASPESCITCRQNRQPPDCQTCRAEYFGLNCLQKCSGCTDCDPHTGACPRVVCDTPGVLPSDCSTPCPSGTHGLHCGLSCPTPCAKSCDVITGECLECQFGTAPKCLVDCRDVAFTEACALHCPVECKGECNTVERTCQLCAEGFKSPYCNEICAKGRYGQNCQNECPARCKDGVCDSVSGSCVDCDPGFAGETCEKPVQCKPGTYGETCTYQCPQTCADSLCDPKNGTCFMCLPGTRGEFCDEPCLKGTFGDGCSQLCPERCSGECGVEKGECWQCEPGYRGLTCNMTCEEGTYGDKCRNRCSEFCFNEVCNHTTGYCFNCTIGWSGAFCTEKIAEIGAEINSINDSVIHAKIDEKNKQIPDMRAVHIFLGVISPVFLIAIPYFIYAYISKKRTRRISRKKQNKDDDMKRETPQLPPKSPENNALVSSFHRQKYNSEVQKRTRFDNNNKLDVNRDIEIDLGDDNVSIKSTTVSISSRSEFSSKLEISISRHLPGICCGNSASDPQMRQSCRSGTSDSLACKKSAQISDLSTASGSQHGGEPLPSDASDWSTGSGSRLTVPGSSRHHTLKAPAEVTSSHNHVENCAVGNDNQAENTSEAKDHLKTKTSLDFDGIEGKDIRRVYDDDDDASLDLECHTYRSVVSDNSLKLAPSLIGNFSGGSLEKRAKSIPLIRIGSDECDATPPDNAFLKRISFETIHREMALNRVFKMNKDMFASPPRTSIEQTSQSHPKVSHLFSSTGKPKKSRSILKTKSTPCVGVSPTKHDYEQSLVDIDPVVSPSSPLGHTASADRHQTTAVNLDSLTCGNSSPPKLSSDHWTIRRIKIEPTGSVPSIQMPTISSKHDCSESPGASSPSLSLSKQIYRKSPPMSVRRLSASRSLTSPAAAFMFDNLAMSNPIVKPTRSAIAALNQTQGESRVTSLHDIYTYGERTPTKSSTSLPIRSSIRNYHVHSTYDPFSDCVDSVRSDKSVSFNSHQPERQPSSQGTVVPEPRRTSIRIHAQKQQSVSKKQLPDKVKLARGHPASHQASTSSTSRRSPDDLLHAQHQSTASNFSDDTVQHDSLSGIPGLEQRPSDSRTVWHFHPTIHDDPVPSPSAHYQKPKTCNIIRCSTTRQVSPSRGTSLVSSMASEGPRLPANKTLLRSSSHHGPTPRPRSPLPRSTSHHNNPIPRPRSPS